MAAAAKAAAGSACVSSQTVTKAMGTSDAPIIVHPWRRRTEVRWDAAVSDEQRWYVLHVFIHNAHHKTLNQWDKNTWWTMWSSGKIPVSSLIYLTLHSGQILLADCDADTLTLRWCNVHGNTNPRKLLLPTQNHVYDNLRDVHCFRKKRHLVLT